MSRAIAPFGLRMPPALKAWVTERAARNRRSLNAEIVRILEERQEAEAGDAVTSKSG